MAEQVFVYIVHNGGVADDSALEMITAAGKMNPDASVTAIAVGAGADLEAVCNEVASTYQDVWKVDDEALAYPNAEIYRGVIDRILPPGSIFLAPNDTFGIDLMPGLSIIRDTVFLSDVVDFEGIDGEQLKAVRQEYSGMVSTHMDCDISGGAIITTRPGVFKPDESKGGSGQITDKTAEAMEGSIASDARTFLEVVDAEAGDVDITKEEILVSVGRGIEEEDNLELAFDLAKSMGGEVSCSRPIVDSKWLEKSRQVGTSGQTVKPKVYLALGISGSFQHLGGIKGSPFIVAINKNQKAPIFQVAEIGVEGDIMDYMPVLTEKINEAKG